MLTTLNHQKQKQLIFKLVQVQIKATAKKLKSSTMKLLFGHYASAAFLSTALMLLLSFPAAVKSEPITDTIVDLILTKDEEPVQVMFKYSNLLGLTFAVTLGVLVVDIPDLKVASISTIFGNLAALEDNIYIETVDIDHDVYAIGDDHRYHYQNDQQQQQLLRGHHHRHLVETPPYGLAMVQADQLDLPDPPAGSDPIKVCVVDTGYTPGHEDLPANNVNGFSPYTGQMWNFDGSSHGTHVAGTIGAIGGNGIGVDSVLSDPNKFTFFIGKGLQDSGSGSSSGVLAAVQACANAGAKVVNLSLGGSGYSATLENAYRDVFNQGVLLVAAAGNGGDSSYSYPASYPHMISVAAVDSNENRAGFSQFNDQVELAAPGVGVRSTVPDNGYSNYAGTSMASPHVTGVAALVWAHFPQCSNLQIRNVLYKTAKDKGAPGCDVEYGAGIVQAKAAYDLLLSQGCEAGGVTPSTPSDGNVGGCAQNPDFTPAPTFAPTPYSCPVGSFRLELLTDNYPQETSYEIRDALTNAIVAKNGSGYSLRGNLYTEQKCLGENGNFVFIIKDTYGDGVCCGYGQGSYTIFVDDVQVGSGGQFTTSESTSFSTGSSGTPAPVTTPTPTSAPVTTPTPTSAPITATPTSAPVTSLPTTTPSIGPTSAPTTPTPSSLPSTYVPTVTPPVTSAPEVCMLGQVGDACSVDGDCCSNKCRGPNGGKTCKNG